MVCLPLKKINANTLKIANYQKNGTGGIPITAESCCSNNNT